MPVPEAAVNEDHRASARKHEVGLSGQILPVETEAIAQSVDKPPDDQFRGSVLAFHRAHDRAALGR
jgi:hypothetical protein